MTTPWTCGAWAACLQVTTARGVIVHIAGASAAHLKATVAVEQCMPGCMLAVFFGNMQRS